MDQRLPPLGIFRPPTGSDVAREAGVSKSAVSRAFTGGVVSAEARERILKAARKLRYRPSLTARSLTTSQSKLIGVAVTHLDNQFYPEIIERLSLRLGAAGFRIVLFVTRGDADLERCAQASGEIGIGNEGNIEPGKRGACLLRFVPRDHDHGPGRTRKRRLDGMADERLAVATDHDVLPRYDLVDQLRQTGLRVVDVHRFHGCWG